MTTKRKGPKVLVLAAHPDDDVIGAGGTIRKLADQGATIRLVVFSAGAEGYIRAAEKATIVARRARETQAVCKVLGIRECHNEGWLDWNLKVDNAGYHAVIRHIREFRPDLVFTHRHGDYNDHKVMHDLAVEGWFHAAIPCAMDLGPVWKHVPLYEFEVLEPMAEPSVVVDITGTYAAKVKAMEAYGSQHELVGGVFQMLEGRALERGHFVQARYGEAFRRVTYRPRKVTDVARLLE